jgi:dTDP-4-dehydrorhamnose reductase
MKVLITGAGGQLGCDLVRTLHKKYELISVSKQHLDVSIQAAVNDIVNEERPHVIIHAGAYTNVDQAEQEANQAYAVNAQGTKYIAQAAKRVKAKLVYVSTDYVFDGRKNGPYIEQDETSPLNIYGKSKLLGEKYVRSLCKQYFIVRTAWVYGRSGHNFVTKMIDQINKQKEISLVHDQIGSPTYAIDLARMIEQLMATERYGVYHACNRGACSRYEFGQEILRLLRMSNVNVRSVPSTNFSLSAIRPAYSVLDDQAVRLGGFTRMRDWRSALKDFLHNDLDLVV